MPKLCYHHQHEWSKFSILHIGRINDSLMLLHSCIHVFYSFSHWIQSSLVELTSSTKHWWIANESLMMHNWLSGKRKRFRRKLMILFFFSLKASKVFESFVYRKLICIDESFKLHPHSVPLWVSEIISPVNIWLSSSFLEISTLLFRRLLSCSL